MPYLQLFYREGVWWWMQQPLHVSVCVGGGAADAVNCLVMDFWPTAQ
jgi:hypothetical protein